MWKALLKAIKAHGYKGKDNDLAAVKLYLDTHFGGQVALDDKGEKPVDVDGEYAKEYPAKPKLNIGKEAQDEEIERKAQERAAQLVAESDEITGKAKKGKEPKHDVKVGTDGPERDPARGFKHMGEFALAVKHAGSGQTQHENLKYCVTKAPTGLQAGIGSDGGFLIPPTFSTTILEGMSGASDNLLDGAQTYTIEGESFTMNANAETSRATGSRWGGARAFWLSEAAQMTGSRPRFRQVKLEPQQLGVLIYATDKLMNNSPIAIGEYLSRCAVDEINFAVGDSMVNGTGAGQPLGIIPSGGTISIAKESGQAAATIVSANVIKMFARFNPRYISGAEWLVNTDTLPQLQTMSLSVGVTGQLTYLPPGGLSQAPYGTLFGLPVRPIEYCATLGTQGDIILVNRRAYLVGRRGEIQNAMSMHLRFDFNETAFRFMFEIDGQPAFASALTPFKGSNTTSPFVMLDTRA